MSTRTQIALLIGLALGLLLVPPRFATGIGLAETACSENNVDPSTLRGDAAEGDWVVYQNTRNGLSFRYPPSMRVEERAPEPFHFDNPSDVIVDLLNNRDFVVMSFICHPGEKTPEMAAKRDRALLETHPEPNSTGRVSTGAVGSIQIDGHEAIVSCGCGRAACTWSVLTLQPRECGIFPVDPGDPTERLFPLQDGEFPLLSIIQTVHFSNRSANKR